jgi:alkylation response protein AidB-like acyl-CoA dehydrogenase
MFEWSEEHRAVRDAVRQFVEREIVPRRDELEHGDLPPYDLLRQLYRTFGMDELARAQFARRLDGAPRGGEGGGGGAAFTIGSDTRGAFAPSFVRYARRCSRIAERSQATPQS